ncbi:MAG TPA: metallophosphoesterase [Acidimicrobiia bacterium]
MRVLVSGDWHAGSAHATRTIDRAVEFAVDRIIQVGDFGFWPRFDEGQSFLDVVSQEATSRGVHVYFCDGNHEDHDALPHGSAVGPVEIRPGISWVPRGTVLEWARRRLLFFGGAVSVDQDSRTSGWTWFANEIPDEADWQRAHSAGQVDVVIAHDTVPEMPVRGLPPLSIPWSARRRASEHRRRLRDLCRSAEPSWWFHGHFHQRASAQIRGTRFESLGHDRGDFDDSYVVLDLETLELVTPLR